MNVITGKLGAILVALVFMTAVQSRAATIIDFDDLTGSGAVPTDYKGLTWTGWAYYDSPQDPYFASSGATRVYNEPRTNANLIEFNQTVTLESLWMAGYGAGQYVIGYSGGVAIFTSTPQANDFNPFGGFLSLNWAGIDAISIYAETVSGIQDHYILDDITFTARSTSVPDSGLTLVWLGASLGLMGLVSRRLRA
jgi:hypothetical protein